MSVAPKKDDVEKGWKKSTVRSIRRVLTETPGDEWYSFFKKYDTDGNDLIPMERFKKFIHEDAVQLSLTTEEVDELLRNADTNGDNFIDFAEFAALMTQIKKMYLKRAEIFAARTVLPRRQQSVRARQLLRYNCCPPPIFLILISIVEVGVFVYQRKECGWKMCFLDEIFVVKYDSPWEIWRYFTYMFFHASYDHLWGNVTMTLIVGSTLELAHRWRITLVYILGSASAGLFSEAVHCSNNNRMGGASGAFFALLAAHLSNVALNWDEMEHPYTHTILVTLYMSGEIFSAVNFRAKGIYSDVSYSAHIGGFIAGVLLGILLLRNVVQEKWEVTFKKTALVLYVLMHVLCIILIIMKYSN